MIVKNDGRHGRPPHSGAWRCLGLLFALAACAFAQSTTLAFVDPHPCCLAPDGHGNTFSVSSIVVGGTSVSRVSADGTVLSTFHFQVGTNDAPKAAALDTQGHLWVAGNSFIAELDSSGTTVLYSTPFAGAINAIAFDAAGNLYAGGATNRSDFPFVEGSFKSKFGSPQQPLGWIFDGPSQYGFVAKFAGGTKLAYTAMLGGEQLILTPCPASAQCYVIPPRSEVNALWVDSSGLVTAAGTTDASDFPITAGVYQATCQCQSTVPNGFVTRINPQGSALVWSTFLGTTTPSINYFGMTVSGVALDGAGNVVIDGTTAMPNFPVTAAAVEPAYTGGPGVFNGFVAKFDSTASKLLFSTYYGGASLNQISAPRLDPEGNIWLTAQVNDRTGLVLRGGSLVIGSVIGSSLIAALSPDGSAVAFSEVLPNGIAGQDLLLNSDGTLTSLGAGQVLRHAQSGPSGVSILGVADTARNMTGSTIAPGEYVSIYGQNLGPGGTQVFFDGIPAQVTYQSSTQLNVLAPFEIAGRDRVQMQVVTAAGSSQTLPVTIVPAQPSVFGITTKDSTLSIYVSGAGVGQAIQVVVSFYYPGPHGILSHDVTLTPSYAGPADGAPPNLMRIDVPMPEPNPSAYSAQLVVVAGTAGSPAVPLTIFH